MRKFSLRNAFKVDLESHLKLENVEMNREAKTKKHKNISDKELIKLAGGKDGGFGTFHPK